MANIDPYLQSTFSETSGEHNKGTLKVDKSLVIPEGNRDDIFTNPDLGYKGRVQVNSDTDKLEYHDTEKWNSVATEDFVNTSVDFIFNNIQVPTGSEPVIPTEPGQDENIREIGNYKWDDNTNQFITVYTGYTGAYTGDNGRIYWAASPTGEPGTWVKQGICINTGSEDPYLNVVEGVYRVLVEKKSGSTHLGIELFTGDSMTTLTSQGLLPFTLIDWYAQDISSPIEKYINGQYVLYFEGRSATSFEIDGVTYDRCDGAIGIATSIDGLNYTVGNGGEPILMGSQLGVNTWFSHIVCDDIIELNSKYYMTTHAYNSSTFVCGVFEAIEIDSVVWNDTLNTYLSIDNTDNDGAGNGVMFLRKNRQIYAFNCSSNSVGIYQGILNVRANDKVRYTSRTSATIAANTALAASGRNEIISTPITSNTYFDLRLDDSSKASNWKIINNNSAYTLTIVPQSGVTINGSSSNYNIGAGKTMYWYLSAANTWQVFEIVTQSITIDSVPTDGSSNAVSSNGVFDALAPKGNLSGGNTWDGVQVFNNDLDLPGVSTEFVSGAGNRLSIPPTVRAVVLTGFTAGAGTVSATDNILQAFQKIVGNIALKANKAGDTYTGTHNFAGATVVGLSVTNTSLVSSQTAADLNTLYPTAPEGFEVLAPNITPARVYKKTSVSGQWIDLVGTTLNP